MTSWRRTNCFKRRIFVTKEKYRMPLLTRDIISSFLRCAVCGLTSYEVQNYCKQFSDLTQGILSVIPGVRSFSTFS